MWVGGVGPAWSVVALAGSAWRVAASTFARSTPPLRRWGFPSGGTWTAAHNVSSRICWVKTPLLTLSSAGSCCRYRALIQSGDRRVNHLHVGFTRQLGGERKIE